jgi:thiol-disulfide isomerase/thioredoxin
MKQKYFSFFLVALLFATTLIFSACSTNDEENTFTEGEIITPEAAAELAETFINDHLMLDDTLVSVSYHGIAYNMYHLHVSMGGEEPIDSFITKDGKLFFPQHLEIERIINMVANQQPPISTDTPQVNEPLELNDEFFTSDSKVIVYFFGSDTCPYCRAQKEAMTDEWKEKFSDSDLEIKIFETENNGVMNILSQLAIEYGTSYQGVPMTFIGSEYWIGYSEDLGAEMIEQIEYCLTSDCEIAGERLK